jgi:hypothetical protein
VSCTRLEAERLVTCADGISSSVDSFEVRWQIRKKSRHFSEPWFCSGEYDASVTKLEGVKNMLSMEIKAELSFVLLPKRRG